MAHYEILRCLNCSLVFTDDRTAPATDSLYPVFDQSANPFAKGVGSALKIFLRQRQAFVQRLKKSGPLLDFGCGNGAFAKQMSRAGFDTVGLEQLASGVTTTSTRLKLIQAPLEQVEKDLGLFDVITLWHVLEHLRRPVDVLQRLAQHLAPDGVIVVSVPNFASLQSAVFGGNWFHLDPPRHLSHFEPRVLDECFKRAALIPVLSKDFLPEYGCSGWAQSSLNATLPHKNYLYEL